MMTIEIICLANFRTSPNLGDLIHALSNVSNVYTGPQIEDPTQGYIVMHWPSLQSQHFGRTSSAYDALLKSSGDHVINTYVVPSLEPSGSIGTVFETPVSEFAVAKLKSEENRERWETCLRTTLQGIKITKGAVAGIHATEERDPDMYVFVIGWSSIEDHQEALAQAYASDIYNDTINLTDFVAKHARLRKGF